MIEVNLYSIPAGSMNSMVGRCVARSRFDKESMGVSVMEFVKGFLRNNLSNFESSIGNSEIVEFINSDTSVMGTKDLASINYWLCQAGFLVQIQNVADDEENAVGVPSGDVVEWNVIDYNFLQNDYPTATKIIPGEGTDIPKILHQIVEQSGLFNPSKLSGVKNPFSKLLNSMDSIMKTTGSVNPSIASQIYDILGDLGIKVFCATSED